MQQIRSALSLFNGISGLHLALDKAQINVEQVYYSEIDKFANKVTEQQYPNDIALGDVTKWKEWDIDWASIDLVGAGSPCTGFSMAGKQGATKAIINGEVVLVKSKEEYIQARENGAEFLSQSYLFWEFILILEHVFKHNPNAKFILENVRMKKEYIDMITEAVFMAMHNNNEWVRID